MHDRSPEGQENPKKMQNGKIKKMRNNKFCKEREELKDEHRV